MEGHSNSTTADKKYLYSPSGRVCALISHNALIKIVRSSKHLLYHPRGWAIDCHHLVQAREAGVKTVVVRDDDTGDVYTTNIESFTNHGRLINRGYGAQSVLELGHWKVTRPAKPPAVNQMAFELGRVTE